MKLHLTDLLQRVAGLAILTALSMNAVGQTVTVGSVQGSTSDTTVEVPWSLEPGDTLQGFQFEISYDNSLFTPDLTNCLANETADQQSCAIEGSAPNAVVSIGLLNFSDPLVDTQSGTITFTIAGGTTADTYPLGLSEVVVNTEPSGTSVTLVPGAIQLQDIAPNLDLDPTSLTFSAENGTSAPAQTVQACNDGNTGGLTFTTIELSGADSGNFSSTDNCPTSGDGLAVDACCQIDVSFSPDAVDSFAASLDVTSSNGSGSVTLAGTGTAGPAPTLAIAPTTFDFGEALTNVDTPVTVFTVSNTGDSGSNLSIDTISGLTAPLTVSGGTCVAGTTELGAGDSCTVGVTFTPTADGSVSQSLSVDGTDTINTGSQSVSATVEGEGVTRAIFSSDPAPGNVNLGFAGSEGELDQDVTVSNSGNGALDLTCTIDENEGDVFTIAPLSFSVAADDSATFNVACSLPDLDTYTATLSCDTTDPDNTTVEYTFSCSGLEPLPVPTMSNWSIALFAMLMLLVGGFSIRFFRT